MLLECCRARCLYKQEATGLIPKGVCCYGYFSKKLFARPLLLSPRLASLVSRLSAAFFSNARANDET